MVSRVRWDLDGRFEVFGTFGGSVCELSPDVSRARARGWDQLVSHNFPVSKRSNTSRSALHSGPVKTLAIWTYLAGSRPSVHGEKIKQKSSFNMVCNAPNYCPLAFPAEELREKIQQLYAQQPPGSEQFRFDIRGGLPPWSQPHPRALWIWENVSKGFNNRRYAVSSILDFMLFESDHRSAWHTLRYVRTENGWRRHSDGLLMGDIRFLQYLEESYVF